MRDPRFVPVVIGVGDVRGSRERAVAAPREPLDLIADAAALADKDSGAASSVLGSVDSISISNVASWAYDDIASRLNARFGSRSGHLFSSPIGGQWPARLLDEAAARIATGQSWIAVVAGGEAQASVTAMRKAGRDPVADAGWTAQPGGPPSFDLAEIGSERMQQAGLVAPVRVYPLFENRLRFELGETVQQNTARSSRLYAAFAAIAQTNPVSWQPVTRTEDDIATPGPGNRMVCEPYPLSMNAMPHVDQAAAVLVASLDVARDLGVPEHKIVYVWGGAGAKDTSDILDRTDFGFSTALASALDRTLAAASVGPADIDILDVYSCFPVVPEMATLHLGLPDSVIPTVTGGHSSFGGPLNSYCVHSIVAATRELRSRTSRGEPPARALVHANGGYMTYQHSILLAASEHPDGYIGSPEPVVLDVGGPECAPVTAGAVTVETATVEYSKDGRPQQGFLVARDAAGRRLAAQTAIGDLDSARALSLYSGAVPREIIGTTVDIEPFDGSVRVSAGRTAQTLS